MLYHREIGFPPEAENTLKNLDGKSLTLDYSEHALNAFEDDFRKYCGQVLELPDSITLNSAEIFEIETTLNPAQITKIVVRNPCPTGLDRIFAIKILGWRGFVKTVWHNHQEDTHRTLNLAKYDVPNVPNVRKKVAPIFNNPFVVLQNFL